MINLLGFHPLLKNLSEMRNDSVESKKPLAITTCTADKEYINMEYVAFKFGMKIVFKSWQSTSFD